MREQTERTIGSVLHAHQPDLHALFVNALEDETGGSRLLSQLMSELRSQQPNADFQENPRVWLYRQARLALLRFEGAATGCDGPTLAVGTHDCGASTLDDRMLRILSSSHAFAWAEISRIFELPSTPEALAKTLRCEVDFSSRPGRKTATANLDRFRFVRQLGEGGMGSVALVWDTLRAQTVALKRCHSQPRTADATPRAWARLKQEFRALADVHHPSLVRVLDLGEDDAGTFFTMEAVEGVDLLQYCRANSAVFHRLASVLPSLLEGLSHLHARGLFHGDLKPSNVLVRRSGQAKILDFGVLAELSAAPGGIVGTPAYMAPECVRGLPPSSSIDLYALGAILYQICAGEPPFFTPDVRTLLARQLISAPPPLDARCPQAPAALVALVHALLHKDPARRPSLDELARGLLPVLGARPAALERTPHDCEPLVGRDDIERTLVDGLSRESELGGLLLVGPSGVGKTALARFADAHANRLGYLVLRGRARRNELVAFNAIDGVVDSLAEVLPELERRAGLSLAPTRERAAVAFPVLGPSLPAPTDAAGARAMAFDALAQLLAFAGQETGVLLVIDDLQWADADSLAFLRRLLEIAPKNLKLVATLRDDLPIAASTPRPEVALALRRVEVPPLDFGPLAVIVRRSSMGTVTPGQAHEIASQCGGRAYLAEVAGRLAIQFGAAPVDMVDALAKRIGALELPARKVLCMLTAAQGWLHATDIAEATGLAPGVVDDIARELCAIAIVRRTGAVGTEDQLDLYHDVARGAAHEALGHRGVRDGHDALAALLESRPAADPLRLVEHLLGAERYEDASRRALHEARRAEQRGAYALAAQLYGLAGEKRARVTALIRAGLYVQAREEIDAIGEDDASIAFDRAYVSLMAGEIARGRKELDRTLELAGSRPLARYGAGMLRDAIRFFFLGPPRAPVALGPIDRDVQSRERRQRDAETALLLSWEDPLAAVGWAQRIRSLSDAAGHPERSAFADYVLAFIAVGASGKGEAAPLAQRYLKSARQRARPLTGELELSALDAAVRAMLRFRRGEFMASSEELARIALELEAAGHARTHTHLLMLSNRCGVLMAAERPHLIAPAIDAFQSACPAAQGAMEAHMLIHRAVIAVYQDDRASYTEHCLRMAARKARAEEPRFHHFVAELFSGYGELLWGDPRAVRRRYARALRESRRFRPFATYFAGSVASLLALAEALALRSGDPSASPRRIERWLRIAERAPPFATSMALRASAYAAEHGGHGDRALALLERAERFAVRYDQRCSQAIARYQRGIRIGGSQGMAMVAEARAAVAAVGAKEHILREDR